MPTRNRGAALMILGAVAFTSHALADQASDKCSGSLSAAQIVNCLNPPSKTRSLFGPAKGITVEGDQPPAVPTVNLIVNFEFDSARLTNDGMISLDALGKALSDPSLHNARFEIAGHTDSVGSDTYNQRLSETRANAVRDYLVQHDGLEPGNLVTVGFGMRKLYDAEHPTAAINRRVQVTRLDQASGN